MKSKKVLIAGVLAGIVVIGAGALAYSQTRVTDDEIFRKYITEMAATKSLAQVETYEGTGTQTTVRGVIETESKKFQLIGEVKCNGSVEGNTVTIDATIAQDGEKSYLRLDNAAGTASDSDGNPVDLASAYVNVKNKWYTISEEDKSIKSMFDNSAYIFNSSVLAPGVDKEKIADVLIDKKAFTYSSISKEDGNYIIKFQSHRSEYQDAIKELFPAMTNVDLVLDTIFTDGSTEDSTITVDKAGKYIKETRTDANPCTDMFSTYTGSEQEDQATYISGENRPIDAATFSFPTITEPKPLESMFEDIVI